MKERIPPAMPTITMCQLYILTHLGTGLKHRVEIMTTIMIMVVAVEVDLRWFKFLDCPCAVSQEEVEDWGEDEVEAGNGGRSDQVQDGSKVW